MSGGSRGGPNYPLGLLATTALRLQIPQLHTNDLMETMNYSCRWDGVFTPPAEQRKVKSLRNQLPHENEKLTDHLALRSAQNI
jgi:hypothetical protein